METIFIWDELDANLKFFSLPGDYSKLDGIYINAGNNEILEEELSNLMYDQKTFKLKYELSTSFPYWSTSDDFKIVRMGFIP